MTENNMISTIEEDDVFTPEYLAYLDKEYEAYAADPYAKYDLIDANLHHYY